MMNPGELVPSVAAFGGGLALGAAFQLGLWWTVVHGLGARRSALWFPASLALRTGATVAGFYLIGAGRWERFLACLIGFLAAQLLVTGCAPRAAARSRPGRSTDHAS